MPRRVAAARGQSGSTASGPRQCSWGEEARGPAPAHPTRFSIPAARMPPLWSRRLRGPRQAVAPVPRSNRIGAPHREAVCAGDCRRTDAAAGRLGWPSTRPARIPSAGKKPAPEGLPMRLAEPEGPRVQGCLPRHIGDPHAPQPIRSATRGIWPEPSPSSVTATGSSPNLPAAMRRACATTYASALSTFASLLPFSHAFSSTWPQDQRPRRRRLFQTSPCSRGPT